MMTVPTARITAVNDEPVRGGDYVLYWMTSARRTRSNYGLQRAIEAARGLGVPVLVLEALRVGYPWASDRLHAFVMDGMVDNARAFTDAGVAYYPYIEPSAGAGSGLLAALAARAALVVTDEFPAFFLPRMIEAAGRGLDVRLEKVDSNGVLPLRAAGRAFTTAASFRRHLQKKLFAHLPDAPDPVPFAAGVAGLARVAPEVASRWPAATRADLDWRSSGILARLPIDHEVAPGPLRGGSRAARTALACFVGRRLPTYHDTRSHPDLGGESGLSPWLHFGHLGAHEVLAAVIEAEGWQPGEVLVNGSRGWWGMSDGAEAFVDQLVTWRELGYVWCHYHPTDYDSLDALPDWARQTLAVHTDDPRSQTYTLEQLARAETHDPVWNAAQRQLVAEGVMPNAVRMVWGKRVLEWMDTPQEALDALVELNNRYALDGRDPNSWSGIFWVFGRFDRAWGPERPIYGKVRYMSSDRAPKKWRMDGWLERWSTPTGVPSSP